MTSPKPLLGVRRALPLFLCTLTVLCWLGCSSGAESERPATSTEEPQRGAGEETAATEGTSAAEDPVAPEQAPATTRMEDGFFMADGAPPPQACSVAADCVGDTVPAATGCCQAPHPIRPHSRAYKAWVAQWRAASCGGVPCPPPPPPSQPAECHFELRCEAGQCRDACP